MSYRSTVTLALGRVYSGEYEKIVKETAEYQNPDMDLTIRGIRYLRWNFCKWYEDDPFVGAIELMAKEAEEECSEAAGDELFYVRIGEADGDVVVHKNSSGDFNCNITVGAVMYADPRNLSHSQIASGTYGRYHLELELLPAELQDEDLFYNGIGRSDAVISIKVSGYAVGLVYISQMPDEAETHCCQIDWLELFDVCQRKHMLKPVMNLLSDTFGKLYFDCTDENFVKYRKIGAIECDYDPFRGTHLMQYRNTLTSIESSDN